MYRPFPSKYGDYPCNGTPFQVASPPPYRHSDPSANFLDRSEFREMKTIQFCCETCDREFPSSQLLQSHVQQHEKCNIDGCQFIAHPKVITKHIQMQHSSGLYSKISKLNNPEAINKWREERKQKYPTKCNIDKKAAEIQEKINRGEKMYLQMNRKCTFLKSAHHLTTKTEGKPGNGKNYKKCDFKRPLKSNLKKVVLKKKDKVIPIHADNKHKLKPFTGIQDLFPNCDSEEETTSQCSFQIDDDEISDNQVPLVDIEKKTALCGALSNLICSYGSSDEEIEKSANIDATINCEKRRTVLLKQSTEKEANISDNESGPDEVKTIKLHNVNNNFEQATSFIKTRAIVKSKTLSIQTKKIRKCIVKNSKHKLPSTLLQKLLFREIRQERNIVLQCVRHIIDNKYFDKNK